MMRSACIAVTPVASIFNHCSKELYIEQILRLCRRASLSESSQSLVVWVALKVALDSSEQVLLNLGGHECSALGQQLLDQVVQIDLLEALASDQVYTKKQLERCRQNARLTQAVLLELVLPSALNELLSQVFLKTGLLTTLFELLFDETLLERDVRVMLSTYTSLFCDYQLTSFLILFKI